MWCYQLFSGRFRMDCWLIGKGSTILEQELVPGVAAANSFEDFSMLLGA
jgi:hypothetical protein